MAGLGGKQALGAGEVVAPLNGIAGGGCSSVGKPSSGAGKALQRRAI